MHSCLLHSYQRIEVNDDCLGGLIGSRLLSHLDQCPALNDLYGYHKIQIETFYQRFIICLENYQDHLNYDFYSFGISCLYFSLGLDSMNSSWYNFFVISLQFQTFQ